MRSRTERAVYRGLAAALVLAVVAAIFLPLTTGYRNVQSTVCLSNVKGLGTGLAIYAVDHDGALPVATGAGLPTGVGWADRIFRYVGTAKIYADPAERRSVESYAMNANAVALPKLAAIVAPERSVLLYEIAGARSGRGGDLHATLRLSPVGDGAAGGLLDSIDPNLDPIVLPATGALANSGLNSRLKPRHRGRSMFLRADTSAASREPLEVSAGANARVADDAAMTSGGRRPDLPGLDRPRAEGSARRGAKSTFSLR